MTPLFSGYYVNKRNGIIYHATIGYSWDGTAKISCTSINAKHERDYVYKGKHRLNIFLNNNYFIVSVKECSFDLFEDVISNKKLKSDLKYGFITKKEFFNKLNVYFNGNS